MGGREDVLGVEARGVDRTRVGGAALGVELRGVDRTRGGEAQPWASNSAASTGPRRGAAPPWASSSAAWTGPGWEARPWASRLRGVDRTRVGGAALGVELRGVDRTRVGGAVLGVELRGVDRTRVGGAALGRRAPRRGPHPRGRRRLGGRTPRRRRPDPGGTQTRRPGSGWRPVRDGRLSAAGSVPVPPPGLAGAAFLTDTAGVAGSSSRVAGTGADPPDPYVGTVVPDHAGPGPACLPERPGRRRP